jgi:hypothetical protein
VLVFEKNETAEGGQNQRCAGGWLLNERSDLATRRRLRWRAVALLLLGAVTHLGGQAPALADTVAVITDIQEWRHPVKDVFSKYKVTLDKVELYQNKTYPVFYVRLPYDPRLGHNDRFFKPLYYDTLKANGFWSYALVDRDDGVKITITWDKKTRTMNEDIQDLK